MTTISIARRSAVITGVIDAMTNALRITPDQIVRLSGGGSLRAYGPSLTYLVNDRFITDRAAGAINGTQAEPGGTGTTAQKTRTVNDTGSVATIADGKLIYAGGSSEGNPGLWYGAFTRAAGRMLVARCNIASFNASWSFGWDSNQSALLSADHGISLRATNLINVYDGGSIQVGTGTLLSPATDYYIAIIMRSTGMFAFLLGGNYTYPTLLWVSTTNPFTATPQYPCVQGGGGVNVQVAQMAVPDAIWLPSPAASDAFTRPDGALGSTDGAGHVEANGGSGKVWTDRAGTWSITSNAAGASALAGGLALATVNAGTADIMHDVGVTRSGGVAGSVVRYVDASNYVVAYHDGTNAKLDKVVAGVTTNVISAAATYSAGKILRVTCYGSTFELHYNKARIGAGTISDAALQSATAHGLYTTDTGNRFDNLVTWPRGTAGEWAALQSFFQ